MSCFDDNANFLHQGDPKAALCACPARTGVGQGSAQPEAFVDERRGTCTNSTLTLAIDAFTSGFKQFRGTVERGKKGKMKDNRKSW